MERYGVSVRGDLSMTYIQVDVDDDVHSYSFLELGELVVHE
jgi:hypothetical protein